MNRGEELDRYLAMTDAELEKFLIPAFIKEKFSDTQMSKNIEILREEVSNDKLINEFYEKYNLHIGPIEMFHYGLYERIDNEPCKVLIPCRLISGDKPEYVAMMKDKYSSVKVEKEIADEFFNIMGSLAKTYRKNLKFREEIEDGR